MADVASMHGSLHLLLWKLWLITVVRMLQFSSLFWWKLCLVMSKFNSLGRWKLYQITVDRVLIFSSLFWLKLYLITVDRVLKFSCLFWWKLCLITVVRVWQFNNVGRLKLPDNNRSSVTVKQFGLMETLPDNSSLGK